MKQNTFSWYLDDRFTPNQLLQIQTAGLDLEAYLNDTICGRGLAWILAMTHGIHIHRGGLPATIAALTTGLPTSLVFPYHDIWLADDFDRFHLPKRHFLHELGHVVENHLPIRRFLPPTICGGGASDRLTYFLGGKPSGLRYMNGTSGIPKRFQWQGAGIYGNHSTADYFAEAMSWLPYNAAVLPDPVVADWFIREVFSI